MTRVLRLAIVALVLSKLASATFCFSVPVSEWRTPQYAVFIGMVVSKAKNPTYFGEVTLDVREVFHGIPIDTRHTTLDLMLSPHLQSPFVEGATLLVVALRIDGKLRERVCPLSKPINAASAEVAWVRKWKVQP